MSSLPPHRLTEGYEPKAFPQCERPFEYDTAEPTIDNLDELARIIRTMTYDELITLREESGIDVRKLYGWSMK